MRVLLLPVVQPPAVELRVLVGTHRLVLAHRREGVVRVAGTEVHGGVRLARQATAREHAVVRTVRGERHVARGGAQVRDGHVVQLGEILLVAGRIAAVLVLDLGHNDAASVRDHVGREHRKKCVEPLLHRLHVLGILGSDLDTIFLQQPVGQTTELPLSADIGSGTHNHEKTVLLGEREIAVQIVRALEVEHAPLGLVHVPRDVRLDGVHARVCDFLEGILPARRMHAEVVEGGGHELNRLSVQHIGVAADGEVPGEGYG